MPTFMMILLMFVSILLILVILLQRGRGGGLVGALSGLGGQSAFGTKAGDMFTRITIGMAAVWVLLAGLSGHVLRKYTVKYEGDKPAEIRSLTKDTGATSAIDDPKGSEDDSNGTGVTGTDSKAPTKSNGKSAAAKRSDEPNPDATGNTTSNAESDESTGESKSPIKKESDANKPAPAKDPDSPEKPGDSK